MSDNATSKPIKIAAPAKPSSLLPLPGRPAKYESLDEVFARERGSCKANGSDSNPSKQQNPPNPDTDEYISQLYSVQIKEYERAWQKPRLTPPPPPPTGIVKALSSMLPLHLLDASWGARDRTGYDLVTHRGDKKPEATKCVVRTADAITDLTSHHVLTADVISRNVQFLNGDDPETLDLSSHIHNLSAAARTLRGQLLEVSERRECFRLRDQTLKDLEAFRPTLGDQFADLDNFLRQLRTVGMASSSSPSPSDRLGSLVCDRAACIRTAVDTFAEVCRDLGKAVQDDVSESRMRETQERLSAERAKKLGHGDGGDDNGSSRWEDGRRWWWQFRG